MNKFQENLDKMVDKILNEEINKKAEKIAKRLNEQLKGNQNKLDVAEPKGKLTKADFDKLRKSKKSEVDEFYYSDEDFDAQERSDDEPTYVGSGLSDNEPGEMYASFDDKDGWYNQNNSQYTGDFDFDYDEEEFPDYESFNQKHGKKQRWFGDLDGKDWFDRYKKRYGKPFRVRTPKSMEESETDEGNAFTGALANAKKSGKDSFEVDGKKYSVKESKEVKEKWEGDVDVKKTGQYSDMSIEELNSTIKKLKDQNEKLKEAGKSVPEKNKTKMSQLYFAKRAKQGWKGKGKAAVKENKSVLKLSESELVDLIEKIVIEEQDKVKSNITLKTPVGLKTTQKVLGKNKTENLESAKQTTKKMKDYLKKASKGEYTENPKEFPKGNGELGNMKKKAYKASEAVEEYIESFAYPGMENNHYDEIKPNEEWLEKNIEGSSETGNNPEWANAVQTDLGKKVNEKRKKNLYDKEKQRSYRRVTQPVDNAGEHEGEGSLDKMFAKLESTENKKEKLINEEMEKMKNLINYNAKTQ